MTGYLLGIGISFRRLSSQRQVRGKYERNRMSVELASSIMSPAREEDKIMIPLQISKALLKILIRKLQPLLYHKNSLFLVFHLVRVHDEALDNFELFYLY